MDYLKNYCKRVIMMIYEDSRYYFWTILLITVFLFLMRLAVGI